MKREASRGPVPHPDPLTFNAAQDDYWRGSFVDEPYYNSAFGFEDYVPAYRMGYEGRGRYAGQRWEDVEDSMRRDWETFRGTSRMEWDQAAPAARAAWHRREQDVYVADDPNRP